MQWSTKDDWLWAKVRDSQSWNMLKGPDKTPCWFFHAVSLLQTQFGTQKVLWQNALKKP